MTQDRFWLLLSRKLSGEAGADELSELAQLMRQHPEWQYAAQNLEDLWNQSPPEKLHDAEDAFMLHMQRLQESNSRQSHVLPLQNKSYRKKRIWIATAAAALLLSFLILLPRLRGSAPGETLAETNEISTKPGSRTRVQLPDSTVVWLNAGSKISYDKSFGKQTRTISLTGEAYFDVVKNGKPFIINTSQISIKVLGTVFNVKAYPEDGRTETSLIEGKIEVTIKTRPDDKIILAPNEKLVVETNEEDGAGKEGKKGSLMYVNKLRPDPVDSSLTETQWIDDKLAFSDESFIDLARNMERWYNVRITIEDEQLSRERFTGSFERENIDQALEALRFSILFRFEKTGNAIRIYR